MIAYEIEFDHWPKVVQHNKQYHRKVLLCSFRLNGYTIGFHFETRNLEFYHHLNESTPRSIVT